MSPRVDHLELAGTVSLDGGTWEVENNVWLVGDDQECVVVDAPHHSQAILAAVGTRRLLGILCTHAHDDHVGAAAELSAAAGAPVWLHPADRELWDRVHPDRAPDAELHDGEQIPVAGLVLHTLHTPGHSPGGVSFFAPDLSTVFTGDTLFAGGPGATGRSFSDFPTIITSIRDQLLTLPADTVVRTGHGGSTSIGAEAPHLQEWVDRGH